MIALYCDTVFTFNGKETIIMYDPFYEKSRNKYGIEMDGSALDGETLKVLPWNMTRDIKTILCYDYEDGKPWHDVTCVMEIIFHNKHHELDGDEQHIRFLYEHPKTLLDDLAKLNSYEADAYTLTAVRMDLTGNFYQHDYKDDNIRFDDFEEFKCTIRHKKHFHPDNPEMPDD